MRLLLLLATLTWAAPGPRGKGAADPHKLALQRAQSHLERGQWRMAAQQYRALLLNRPKSPIARVGLARALAAVSDCGEALELLESVRGKWAWNADASLAEARCYLQQGRHHDAVEAYRYATHLNPRNPSGWFSLAQTQGLLGDQLGVEQALEGLLLCDGGHGLSIVVRTELALRQGDDAFDGWHAQSSELFGPTPALAIYDARAWLDRGDPFTAQSVLLEHLRASSGHAQVAFWRAEALRRLGSTASADAVFRRPVFRWATDDGLALSLRARVFVDLGELERAEELVDRLADPMVPESLATRWYLARARGLDWEADRLAVLWRGTDPAAGRTLAQLVPVADPDTVGIPATALEAP